MTASQCRYSKEYNKLRISREASTIVWWTQGPGSWIIAEECLGVCVCSGLAACVLTYTCTCVCVCVYMCVCVYSSHAPSVPPSDRPTKRGLFPLLLPLLTHPYSHTYVYTHRDTHTQTCTTVASNPGAEMPAGLPLDSHPNPFSPASLSPSLPVLSRLEPAPAEWKKRVR